MSDTGLHSSQFSTISEIDLGQSVQVPGNIFAPNASEQAGTPATISQESQRDTKKKRNRSPSGDRAPSNTQRKKKIKKRTHSGDRPPSNTQDATTDNETPTEDISTGQRIPVIQSVVVVPREGESDGREPEQNSVEVRRADLNRIRSGFEEHRPPATTFVPSQQTPTASDQSNDSSSSAEVSATTEYARSTTGVDSTPQRTDSILPIEVSAVIAQIKQTQFKINTLVQQLETKEKNNETKPRTASRTRTRKKIEQNIIKIDDLLKKVYELLGGVLDTAVRLELQKIGTTQRNNRLILNNRKRPLSVSSASEQPMNTDTNDEQLQQDPIDGNVLTLDEIQRTISRASRKRFDQKHVFAINRLKTQAHRHNEKNKERENIIAIITEREEIFGNVIRELDSSYTTFRKFLFDINRFFRDHEQIQWTHFSRVNKIVNEINVSDDQKPDTQQQNDKHLSAIIDLFKHAITASSTLPENIKNQLDIIFEQLNIIRVAELHHQREIWNAFFNLGIDIMTLISQYEYDNNVPRRTSISSHFTRGLFGRQREEEWGKVIREHFIGRPQANVASSSSNTQHLVQSHGGDPTVFNCIGSLFDVIEFITKLKEEEQNVKAHGIPFIVYFVYMYQLHRSHINSRLLEFIYLNIAFAVVKMIENVEEIRRTLSGVAAEQLKSWISKVRGYSIEENLRDISITTDWGEPEDPLLYIICYDSSSVLSFYDLCVNFTFHVSLTKHSTEHGNRISSLLVLADIFLMDLMEISDEVEKLREYTGQSATITLPDETIMGKLYAAVMGR